MRNGMVFKKCSRCGGRVTAGACPRCGRSALTWTYVIDTSPSGLARQQRKRGGYRTRREAAAALAHCVAALRAGLPPEGDDLTVGQFLNEWLAGVALGGSIRPTTAKAYEVAIRVHIVPAVGSMPLRVLNRGAIRGMYVELSAGGLAPKAVHNVHLTLHRALQDAVADGFMATNPAARAHRLGHTSTTARAWSAGQLRLFLSGVNCEPDAALWRLAASTGMRRGELLGLRWSDIDLEARTVCIHRQLIRNGRLMEFCQPKTPAGRRTVCLDPMTAEVLDRHRRVRATVPDRFEQDLVFPRQDGQPRDPDAVSHRFSALVRRLGLPTIRLHDPRHTHATLALQAAINPKVVQERLGHASVKVTLDTYTHVLPPMHEEAATRIAALVDLPRGDATTPR